jgi:RND family efflux transporter MFP subunit
VTSSFSRYQTIAAVVTGILIALSIGYAIDDGRSARAQPAAAATEPPKGQPPKPAAIAPPPPEVSWFQRQWSAVTELIYTQKDLRGPAATGKAPAGPPPAVTVSRPVVREIIEWDEYTGRFDAVDTVEVRARVSGYLIEVHFKDGQIVNKGDLLYSIDARPFERALDLAKAELSLAQTRALNAVKDVDRARPLISKKVITEKTFDDRENAYEDAQAQARVSEAKVKTAELDLSFTQITAPITGRIGRANVSAGNYVIGNAFNGTLLTTIVSQDPIHIYIDVNENSLIKYKRLSQGGKSVGAAEVGMPVELALPDDKGFPYSGSIDFVDNRLDASTGTLRVRAAVANSAGFFSPGMFARVRITSSPKFAAILLPDEAIGTDQTNRFVYIVGDDNVAVRRNVTVSSLVGALRVIRTGVTADDWVIVNGLQRARPNIKVTPNRAKAEPKQITTAPAPPPVVAKP